MSTGGWIFIAVVVLLVVFGITIYNQIGRAHV